MNRRRTRLQKNLQWPEKKRRFLGIYYIEGFMLVTSVSLPRRYATLWRKNRKEVLRMAVRVLRLTMRQNAVRRGVKRHYNRRAEKFEIVTTRFTAEQYDILHAAAAAMRVSVSWLVYLMLLLWEKPVRRGQAPQYLTNYSLDCLKWNERVGVITESLYFYPKSTPPEAVETMLYRLT